MRPNMFLEFLNILPGNRFDMLGVVLARVKSHPAFAATQRQVYGSTL